MLRDMGAIENPRRSTLLIADAVPDLAGRVPGFTVLSSPADAEIRSFFLDHVAGLLPELRRARDQAQWPVVARHAHGLKGAGGSVGYPEISVLSESLEHAAKAGDEASVARLLAALADWQDAERGGP